MVIFRKPVPELTERSLSAYVARAQRAVGLRGEVNVLLTTNPELRALNSRFRKKDKPTDVLSFPAIATAEGLVGDVAISVTIAAQNARQLGHGAAEEVKILILHGLLHLAGHDHEQDDGEMARLEQKLRNRLGLPVGLIERNSVSTDKQKNSVIAKNGTGARRAQRKPGQKVR